jgi:hypothetical protein
MRDYLTSPETVQLVPWLRRQNIHVPPAFAQHNQTVDLGCIKQYAQSLGDAQWEVVAAHVRSVCAQHGWRVVDACPVEVVDVPIEDVDVIEVPDVVEEKKPAAALVRRRRRVIKVKKVKK